MPEHTQGHVHTWTQLECMFAHAQMDIYVHTHTEYKLSHCIPLLPAVYLWHNRTTP